MSIYNKNDNKRGYKLILIPDDFEAFELFEKDNLEEIDDFTCGFDNLKDMSQQLNDVSRNKLNLVSAYIERVGGKHTKYNVLYSEDVFDSDKVINTYREEMLKNPEYFRENSPARFVGLEDINHCLLAYFNRKNYRDIRGAYFELKELGKEKKTLINSNKGRNK